MATQIDIDQPPAAGLAGEHAGSVADDSDHRLQALRKKLARRAEPDRSQLFRRTFQIAFLLLNLWIGGAFYFWVRGFELGIHDRNSLRPAGVEGWLPIAGLMNLKYWLTSGHLPGIHPAALFLFLSFLAIAFLFRKAFCSWLCPVGTLSEFLWRAGRRILRRNFSLPRWLDLPLRSLKYVLLGFFVWAVGNMSADAVEEFMRSPYGVIADVRMLNFFRYVGGTAAVILALLVVASVLVQNFWCRYLCPYGALLGIASLLSPFRIRRSADACIDCAKCAKACPSALPVDKLVSIKSAECTGCLECIAVCPAEGALQMALPKWTRSPKQSPKAERLPAWTMAAGIAVLFLGIVGYAKAAGYWNGNVPDYIYRQLVPQANVVEHPAE
ncbi:MAG: 4Fe-4S binding protein [Candidatus Sulfotelmatobacter sp.]